MSTDQPSDSSSVTPGSIARLPTAAAAEATASGMDADTSRTDVTMAQHVHPTYILPNSTTTRSVEEQPSPTGAVRTAVGGPVEMDLIIPTHQCTEVDVLMGRGKRVSEWPGNVFFRQVVNRHRADYARAGRNHKVGVAHKVIDEVRDMGGRFIKEVNPSNTQLTENSVWAPVSESRVVEKTCQALRENKRTQVTTDKHGSESRSKEAMMTLQSYTSSMDTNSTSTTSPCKDFAEECSPSNYHHHHHHHANTNTKHCPWREPPYQQLSGVGGGGFSLAVMVQRLTRFQAAHGHTAVPSAWPEDSVLADWCTVQRQLYREVQSGYRCGHQPQRRAVDEDVDTTASESGVLAATTVAGDNVTAGTTLATASPDALNLTIATMISQEQQNILDTLTKLDFCWDIDEWHWNHRYHQLVEVQQRQQQNHGDGVLSAEVVLWLRQQRQLYRDGALWAERAQKLKDAGVILLR